MLVELGDRLRVVDFELVVWDLVHPGAYRLPEELAASLTTDGVGDRPDGVGWVYKAERHAMAGNLEPVEDGKKTPLCPHFAGS